MYNHRDGKCELSYTEELNACIGTFKVISIAYDDDTRGVYIGTELGFCFMNDGIFKKYPLIGYGFIYDIAISERSIYLGTDSGLVVIKNKYVDPDSMSQTDIIEYKTKLPISNVININRTSGENNVYIKGQG